MARGMTRRQALTVAGAAVVGTSVATTGSGRVQQSVGASQFQADPANSGYRPDEAGPTNGLDDQWTFSTFARMKDDNAPVVADGTAYLAARDFSVYAIDVATGQQQWSIDTGGELRSTPAIGDGSVYVPVDGGRVLALDAASGDRQWEYNFGDQNPNMYVVYDDGTLYFPGVFALDAADGTELWYRDLGSSRGVAVANGSVFVTGGDTDRVWSLDADSGSVQWRKRIGARIQYHVPPTVSNGTLYVVCSDGRLHALDASSGAVQWRYEVGGIRPRSSPAVAGDTVVVGKHTVSEDGNTSNTSGEIHAVDANTGTNRWTVQTTGGVRDSPTILDDVVYVGSLGEGFGTFYALDLVNGATKFSRRVRDDVTAHVVNGTDLYLVTEDGYLTAFSDSVADTATPGGDGKQPTADFQFEPQRPEVDQKVLFDATASSDADGDLTSFRWQVEGPNQNRTGSGRRITLRFGTASEYSVTLTVTDDDGQTDQISKRVVVQSGEGESTGTGSGAGDISIETVTPARQRGFFTNSGEDPSFLSNALNLTVLGFLLSIAGIVHQMIRGR